MLARRDTGDSLGGGPRRQSTHNELLGDTAARRLSEAGVNRRPSASQILTEDTDSFIVGQRVYVDGVKPGRIQYIGETKFGPGEWSGVVLDEPFGRNDGSVGKTRYFQCEPYYGVFSRLFRLTAEAIDGADEVLQQMRRYGYEIVDAPIGGGVGNRRGSVGSGTGSRRGSTSVDDHYRPGSASPRSVTPELRRSSMNRTSPDYLRNHHHHHHHHAEPRKASLTVPERRGSMGQSPMGRKTTAGRSPLASPRASRSYITGGEVKIEKDPAITTLTQEARRLSMGGDKVANNTTTARRPSGFSNISNLNNARRISPKNSSSSLRGNGSVGARRPSEGFAQPRRPSEGSPRLSTQRRGSDWVNGNVGYSAFRRESLGLSGPSARRGSEDTRRLSEEADRRRLSEAGFRRASTSDDAVLNDRADSLMVGQEVWVDGNKHGRIAYIGNVQFAKGEVAGVHLHRPYGKNNGTVGGVMYFQCEPKHGIFARLHRLTTAPVISEDEEHVHVH